jgi:phosphoglycolate phosphatase-like HAD superfamily hydrolase
LVLFDIDGTLIRTGGAGVQAFERTFATEFGVRWATDGISFAGRTDISLARQCFLRHRIDPVPGNFQRFFDTYVFWLHHLLGETNGKVCAGVRELLAGFRRLPKPPAVGLLTGNVRLGAEIKLRHFGLWEHFQIGAFGDDHEDRNELARIARERGLQLLGQPLSGRHILVVGDTPLDIECGNRIHARVLAVGTGGYSCDALRACNPTWAVEDLAQVSPEQVCA